MKRHHVTDHHFLLKCMAALAAAAVVTLGIIAAVATYQASAAAAATLAVAGASTAFLPILPIVLGIAALIGALCLIPLFLGCRSSKAVVSASSGYPSNVVVGGGYGPGFYNQDRINIPSMPRQGRYGGQIHTNPGYGHFPRPSQGIPHQHPHQGPGNFPGPSHSAPHQHPVSGFSGHSR